MIKANKKISSSSSSTMARVSKLPPMDRWDEVMSEANPTHSRTVSPSLEPSSYSFDEWHQDNGWDEVVLMGDDNEEGCHLHFQDSLIAPSSIMLDPSLVGSADPVPSIDEFLVGHTSDNIEIELEDFEAPELPPPPPGSAADEKDTEMPDSPKDFNELYRTTLTNLKESMKRTRESRKCLHAVSPQTKKHPRSKSISHILNKVENSSRQIDQCLDPDFFKRRGSS